LPRSNADVPMESCSTSISSDKTGSRSRLHLMSTEADAVEGSQLKRCGATAFVPKTDLATADLRQLFGATPPPH
jgi:hypothetical protein